MTKSASPNQNVLNLSGWQMTWRIASAVVGFFILFTAAYAIVHYGGRGLHLTLASYPATILTIAVAFLLLSLTGAALRRVWGSRQQDSWQSLLDALRHIAQGDFRVRLDPSAFARRQGSDHPVHQLVQGINDMTSELARLEALRQEFISNVSHEIQSPLAAIAGFAKLLQGSAVSTAENQQYLSIIYTESLRLSRLTENLLKLTSLESGYHPSHVQVLALHHQIRGVIVALEPLWAEKNLTMNIALPPLTVTADHDLLYQVWVNLLTNAIKFTPLGGEISVHGEITGAGVHITIADTGIGIPPEELDRIFERFYKGDKARTRNETGSGLGLAIVKKILDMQNGQIALVSKPGLGTSVAVTLPRS